MTPRARAWLVGVALVCGGYGLCAIVVYALYFSEHPLQDWMVYYAAARAYFDGTLPFIYDGARFTALLNDRFTAWLAAPFGFQPWLYPPHYLLLVLPFGLLPFATAGIAFLLVSFVGLLAALWAAVGDGYRRWLHLASVLLAPAVAFNVGSGQNAFLTSALLVGGFGLLESHPAFAGVLLGVLTYKPQFCLVAPVALVAAREWRVLAIAAITALVMVLLSAAVLGSELWRLWPAEIGQIWARESGLYGQSVATNLVILGAPRRLAAIGQAAATALSAAAAWWCYARAMPRDLRLAVLLAATIVAAPRVTNYDAVLLVIAGTLLFVHGLDNGFGRGGVAVPVLVWMIQLFDPPGVFRLGLLTPLLTLLLIIVAIARARVSPAASAPSCVDRDLPAAVSR